MPKILAFDTTLPHCAAAFLYGDKLITRTEDMARGQAERLMTLLEEVLADAGQVWADLDMIAVGIGPGNFTGIRISVAAARGLALALNIPVMGVSMFEVMRVGATAPAQLVTVDAPRAQVYVQRFSGGHAASTPLMVDPDQPLPRLGEAGDVVVGAQADRLAQTIGGTANAATLTDVAARIAHVAHHRWQAGDRTPDRPAPLYVKPADAAPPRDVPPRIVA
jgi:tRNA threonylcarbamoyladenosine biosynthesis protein TsaB